VLCPNGFKFIICQLDIMLLTQNKRMFVFFFQCNKADSHCQEYLFPRTFQLMQYSLEQLENKWKETSETCKQLEEKLVSFCKDERGFRTVGCYRAFLASFLKIFGLGKAGS
jgi:hypothetical protein